MRRGFELNTIPGNAHVRSSTVMIIINAQPVSSFTESDISRCKKPEYTAARVRKTEIEIIGGMCEAEHHT